LIGIDESGTIDKKKKIKNQIRRAKNPLRA